MYEAWRSAFIHAHVQDRRGTKGGALGGLRRERAFSMNIPFVACEQLAGCVCSQRHNAAARHQHRVTVGEAGARAAGGGGGGPLLWPFRPHKERRDERREHSGFPRGGATISPALCDNPSLCGLSNYDLGAACARTRRQRGPAHLLSFLSTSNFFLRHMSTLAGMRNIAWRVGRRSKKKRIVWERKKGEKKQAIFFSSLCSLPL